MAQTRAPMKNRQKSRSGCRTCKLRRVSGLVRYSLQPFLFMSYQSEAGDDDHDRRRAECTDFGGGSYDAMKQNQDAGTVPRKGSNVPAISSVYNGRPSTKFLSQHSQELSQKTSHNLSLPHPHPLSHPRKSQRRVMFIIPGLLLKHLLRLRLQAMQRHRRPQHRSRHRLYPLRLYPRLGPPLKDRMAYILR